MLKAGRNGGAVEPSGEGRSLSQRRVRKAGWKTTMGSCCGQEAAMTLHKEGRRWIQRTNVPKADDAAVY